jgi:hypothetical protein
LVSGGIGGFSVDSEPLSAGDGEGISAEDVSWVKGSHVLQFGALYMLGIERQDVFTYPEGSFTFSGVRTENAAADYLLGLEASYYARHGFPASLFL